MTNSRAKGARGERELASLLRKYGYDTRRGQQYCGANGDADVVGLPGFHIECKRVERLNLEVAYKQAESDSKPGETPIVVHRKDRHPWLVTMGLRDFLMLIKDNDLDPYMEMVYQLEGECPASRASTVAESNLVEKLCKCDERCDDGDEVLANCWKLYVEGTEQLKREEENERHELL